MSLTRTEKLLLVQTLVLFGGSAFAWSKLIPQFVSFSPNPFLTACLYGSTAFLAVLFWSVRVYQKPSYQSERYLRNFLLFCVVFAASVVSYEAVMYYHLFGSSTNVFICTPGVPPTQTPCFVGMLFFIAAFLVSILTTRHLCLSPEASSDRMAG